MNKDQIRSRY